MDQSTTTTASQLPTSFISNTEESSSPSSPINAKTNSVTEITNQSKPHKLDIHLISLLEGLNERKTRIDQQAQFLSNLPKILPFEPLAPAASDISSKTWEKWWHEHDRIEREADIFREDEFALMKKVAMSKTTNMSREDTDLVGLTLGTLEAFSRLEHLLRSRRKQLQILDLRIKWDQQTKKLKAQLDELQQERPKLISKIRWSPPQPDHPTPVTTPNSTPTPSSPLLRQSLGPQSRSPILSAQTTFPRSRQESLSHQNKPRRSSTRLSVSSLHHPQPDTDHTNGEICASLDQTHTPIKLNNHKSENNDSIDDQYRTPSPTYSARININPESSMGARTHRSSSSSNQKHSFPTTPTPSASLPTSIHSPSSSSQSRAMRIQSLTLQLSSISTKLNTLNRLVIPTSATIDRLIDSGLHLPEAFLDEQDRLEACVRSIMSSDISRFYATLLDQYKQADEIWYHQRSLEHEVEIMKREIESDLNMNRISLNHKPKFTIIESKLNSIIKTHQSHSKKIQHFTCLPTHELYPDQDQLNQALINHLSNGLQRSQQRLDQLIELVNLYKLAVDRIERSKEIRSAMEASKMRFKRLIEDIETLDQSQSKGACATNDVTSTVEIELGADALEGSSSDASDQAWYKIEKQLKIELELAFKLLEDAERVLLELKSLGIDPKIKSDTESTKDDLNSQMDEIEELIRSRNLQIERLKLIRNGWKSFTKAEKEMKTLRTKLIWEIGGLKWKKLIKIEEEKSSTILDEAHHQIPRVPGLLSDAEEKELENSRKQKVKEEERLLTIASTHTTLLKDSTEARQLIETDLELLIRDILNQLPNQPIIHSKFSGLHHLLKDEKLKELERLERIREAIKLQTEEIQNVDNLQEGLMIEGSRLIKRVQDTIGVELDRTYEITSESISKTENDTTKRHKREEGETSVNRGRNRLVTKVKEYIPELEKLVKSLPARIKFVVEDNEGLEIKSYETEVKNFLNGIEMSLFGLRDQLCNEFSLLEWIDCEVGKRFSNGIDDVKLEIRDVIQGLEKVEDQLNGWMKIIGSDRMQPPIPEHEIQAQCHQMITSLTNKLNQEIRTEIDERIPKSLEDFIHQCPSLSSNLFKPDQFILPKQMLQHQLQSYFNSTVRRSEDLLVLRDKLVEINQRRQLEFEWREGWKDRLDESMQSLSRFEGRLRGLSLDLGEHESQIRRWESDCFVSRLEITSIGEDCQAPFPEFQSEVDKFKDKIKSIAEGEMVELRDLMDEVNLKVKRIEDEIKEKLPLDDNLLNESMNNLNRLQPEWESAQDQMKTLKNLISQLQADLDARRSEYDLRRNWSSRCDAIFKESDIEDLIERYETTIDRSLLSSDKESLGEDAHDRFSKALEDLRNLTNYRITELTQIDQKLQLMKSKVSEISGETVKLSKMPDTEHSYLIKANSDILRIRSSFEKVSRKTSEAERRAIERIVKGAGELVQTEEMGVDQFVIAHQIGLESSRVKGWIKSELVSFMREIDEESAEIQKLESLSSQFESGSKAKVKEIKPGGLKSSTSSTSSARLNEENDRLKEQFMEIKRLVAMTSKSHENLTRFELDLPRIVDQIDHFESTLPTVCLSDLRHGLDQTDFKTSFQETGDLNRIKQLRIKLDSIKTKVNKMLEGTEEGMKLCKQQKARSARMFEILERLSSLDLDRWVREPEKRHSPLPSRETVMDIQSRLEGINLEILDLVSELESVLASGEKDETLLERCVKEYDSASSKLARSMELMEFNEAVESCDQSFSRLLDALDHHQNNGSEDEELSSVNQESETKLKEVSMKACGISNDGRVEYQLERLTQTWAELSEMVKDRHESKNDLSNELKLNGDESSYLSQSLLMKKNNSPASKIPVLLERSPIRLRSNSVGSAAGSPSRITAKIPSISTPSGPVETRGTLKHSLGHHAHLNSPYMSSPSLAASCRAGRRTPDQRSASKDHFDSHPPSSGFTRTRAPSSLRGRIGGTGSGLRNRVSLMSMNQGRTAFGLSTPPCTRMDGGIEKKRVQYRAQPNRNIDQMVGKVVNRLAVEVHVAPVEEAWEDNSGLYWIGNKMYFCRILRSQTVMVRIGGGWNELSNFLLEHSKQAVAVSPLRADGLTVAGPSEKWMTSNEARRASAEHSLLGTPTQSLSTPRARTLSAHPMAISTPPEAIQLYLRKADVLKMTPNHASPTPNSVASVSARRHWRP
ncbi:hypothetical protein DFH28DRAFT_1131286 [Melampsora americana]|nr:hypothetical protein DFH28DRAFT_1131286 [Melampsora americana]